jgi:hypothetical protein
MKKIKRKEKLRHVSRLNRLVFGVAILWLVTSVVLLVLAGTGSAQPGRKYQPNNDRTHKDAHHQLYARMSHQAATRSSFIS